jgi:type I restriction enzyme R subunit
VRNLPHWRQAGVTYFVTFRQDDSIPAKVLLEWHDFRQRWFKAHNMVPGALAADRQGWAEAYRCIPLQARRAFERQQARMLHEELDLCHGSCVLSHPEARKIVADSLSYFHGDRLWLGDFVIMPNHAHVLLVPFDGWELEDQLESIKKWTSREIGLWLETQADVIEWRQQRRPRFWQQEAYDRIVRDTTELAAFRRYIAQNPRVAKIRDDEYTYHTANWLDNFAPSP